VQVLVDFQPYLVVTGALLITLERLMAQKMRASGWAGDFYKTVLPTAAAADRPPESFTVAIAPPFTTAKALLLHILAAVAELFLGRVGE
jgi:hypothetical protein